MTLQLFYENTKNIMYTTFIYNLICDILKWIIVICPEGPENVFKKLKHMNLNPIKYITFSNLNVLGPSILPNAIVCNNLPLLS